MKGTQQSQHTLWRHASAGPALLSAADLRRFILSSIHGSLIRGSKERSPERDTPHGTKDQHLGFR
jgi:hypothetical protein